jgi:hypothetical protein
MANFPNIRYFRANAGNLAIARQTGGNGDPALLTDEILTPSLATGVITSTTGSATVTGASGVNFQTDVDSRDGSLMFGVGKYLFAYVGLSNEPTLVGQILSVQSDTSLTLSANGLTAATSLSSGTSRKLITTNEAILVVVPTVVPNANSRIIPNINLLRQSSLATAFNNQNFIILDQYSDAGTPVTINGSPANIDCTVLPQNRFPQGNSTTTLWSTATDLPNNIFILLTPATTLAPKTSYRLRFEELLNDLTVQANTASSIVAAAGYNVQISVGQGGDTGGN